MYDCLNCNDITIPQGNTGDTGPQGPPGTNGTNGSDGASIIDSIYSRPSTSAISTSSITHIDIDVNKIFNSVGDNIDYEVYISYTYISGTDGGSASIYLEDGTNSINLFPSGIPIVNKGLQALIFKGSIKRTSSSSINHKLEITQTANAHYSSPIENISGALSNTYIVTNPGTINNNSASLKLNVKGSLSDGANNLKVEYFRVTALKQLV